MELNDGFDLNFKREKILKCNLQFPYLNNCKDSGIFF